MGIYQIRNVVIKYDYKGIIGINNGNIYISRYKALHGGTHPRDKRKRFKPNGTGAENNKFLYNLIQTLPSSDDFKVGSCFHDWMYLLGKEFATRKTADKVMHWINQYEVSCNKSWWQRRYFINISSPIYYRAVRIGGSSSFYKG